MSDLAAPEVTAKAPTFFAAISRAVPNHRGMRMLVIQTGFSRVGAVALANGQVAVQSGEPPFNHEEWEGLLDDTEMDSLIATGVAWEAEVWGLSPDGIPIRYSLPYSRFWGVHGLALDPVIRKPLCASHVVGVLSADGETVAAPGGYLNCFALSLDGKRLVCGGNIRDEAARRPTVLSRLVSFTRGGKKRHWTRTADTSNDPNTFQRVAFLPDGERLAATHCAVTRVRRGTRTGSAVVHTLRLFDSKSLSLLDDIQLDGEESAITVCGYHVAVLIERAIQIRDSRDLNRPPVRLKAGRNKFISAIAGDPNGRFLMMAAFPDITVWDGKSWTVAKTYDWQAGPVTCLAVAPDGLTAAAGTATGKVVVWDTE